MPLPIVPGALWYVSKKSISIGGSFTRGFFFELAKKKGFTGRFLFRGRFFICRTSIAAFGRTFF